MLNHRSIHAFAPGAALLVLALAVVPDIATAGDEGKYPDLRGQWMGVLRTRPGLPGQPSFDASKPWGKGQEAPLTAEYQAVLEENLKSQKEGSFFDWMGVTCHGFGMPLITYGFEPQEFIVTPETTYILINWIEHNRRIYTDGRDWPKEIEPTLTGYSIGKWIDEDGDGKYDVLEVETAVSRDRAITMRLVRLCTTTTSRCSRSASISTRTTRTSCITRSPSTTTR
jgi:hypothetical protein